MVELLKLVLRNSLRHRLRTTLTVVGMAIAILAFIPTVYIATQIFGKGQ